MTYYPRECFSINTPKTRAAMKAYEEAEKRKNEWIDNWISDNCPEGRNVRTYWKALHAYDRR